MILIFLYILRRNEDMYVDWSHLELFDISIILLMGLLFEENKYPRNNACITFKHKLYLLGSSWWSMHARFLHRNYLKLHTFSILCSRKEATFSSLLSLEGRLPMKSFIIFLHIFTSFKVCIYQKFEWCYRYGVTFVYKFTIHSLTLLLKLLQIKTLFGFLV